MNSNEIKNKITLAKKSSESLLALNSSVRKMALLELSDLLLQEKISILKANRQDIQKSQKEKSVSFIERLSLDEKNIEAMAQSVKLIAQAKDILFEKISESKQPSGIAIRKIVFPLGLVAIVYESRPNVTIDAFSLCFKSGNAVILKGGKEIAETNEVLIKLIRRALKDSGIDTNIIQDVTGIKRSATIDLMKNKKIDCLIPRGGKNLVDFVLENSRIPIIATGASVVHIYVDESANLEMAKKIIFNAKTRRVSICNALDVVLIHKNIQDKFLKLIAPELEKKKVEIRADKVSYQHLKKINYSRLRKVTPEDFDTEFLDYILAVRMVKDFEEAIDHIKKHSLGHSEAIITNSKKQIDQFYREVDAACLYVNTSTQFSDGGEFGMGGEIGISTQKLHARGPFSYHELTTYKYLVSSKGKTRN